MNTNLKKTDIQQNNQNQNHPNNSPACYAQKRKPGTVTKPEESIFEPIVEIISGNQNVKKTDPTLSFSDNDISHQQEYKTSRINNSDECGSTTCGKDKYVFVIMNNVAPATSSDTDLQILDIKPVLSAGNFPLGNVTVNNVTFSADKVQSAVNEVIKNLPDKQSFNLNSGMNHEFLLALNFSIPFSTSDISAGEPSNLPSTQPSIKNLSQSTRPVSKRTRGALNLPEQFAPTSVKSNLKPKSKLSGSEETFEKYQEKFATDNGFKEEPETSTKCVKDIPEDKIYILFVDDDDENTEVVNSSDQIYCRDLPKNKEGVSKDVKPASVKSYKGRFYCENCPRSYKTKRILQQHIRRKSCLKPKVPRAKKQSVVRRRKTSQEADGGTKKKKTYNYKIKSREKICEICGKVYYRPAQFRAHMDTHENLRRFKCSECNSGFNYRFFLQRHIAQVHRKMQLYTYFCSYCGLKSTSKEHIEMHEQVHTLPEGVEVPRPYECSCGKSFISKHALRCHPKTRLCYGQSQEEIKLECPLCGEVSTSAASLSFHLDSKHNVNPSRGKQAIHCNLCQTRFVWFGTYVRHKLLKHNVAVTADEVEAHAGGSPSQSLPRSLVCDVCDKECKSSPALRAHKLNHHGEERQLEKMQSSGPASCQLCDKTFKNKNLLTKHNFQHHRPRDLSQLTCRICQKVFTNYGGLWAHKKYVHAKTLPYCCHVCGNKFKRKGDHSRHLRDKHGLPDSDQHYEPVDGDEGLSDSDQHYEPVDTDEVKEEEFESEAFEDEYYEEIDADETLIEDCKPETPDDEVELDLENYLTETVI